MELVTRLGHPQAGAWGQGQPAGALSPDQTSETTWPLQIGRGTLLVPSLGAAAALEVEGHR